MRGHKKTTIVVVAAGVLLSACGGEQPAEPAASPRPHGYVEGAEETDEAQSRLVLTDARSGAVRVLDLLTEELTQLGNVAGVQNVSTDGRFAYLATNDATHVIDSGSWKVDHGDHVHYYRTRIGRAGKFHGRAVAAHSDSKITTVALSSGRTTTLERPALEDGRVKLGDPVEGLAVPYEQRLVVATGEGVSVRGRDGKTVSEIRQRCPDPEGTGVTRRGVVFGCADGALLVSEDNDEFGGEKIPYPHRVTAAERARKFTQRPGSATLAAPAGERGVWSLDVSKRTWTLLETGPVTAVNAVGESAPLLTLTADGVLHAYDTSTGEQTASRPVLKDGVPDAAKPVIQIDTSRAYLNDPARRRVYEIDYNDELRVARTFDLDITPSHIVETGR